MMTVNVRNGAGQRRLITWRMGLLWMRHALRCLLTRSVCSLSTIQAISSKLHKHLQSIIVLQDHLRVRERRHRATAEANLSRVANWSLFEMIVVMAVGFAQVVAIRRFFKDRDGGSRPRP